MASPPLHLAPSQNFPASTARVSRNLKNRRGTESHPNCRAMAGAATMHSAVAIRAMSSAALSQSSHTHTATAVSMSFALRGLALRRSGLACLSLRPNSRGSSPAPLRRCFSQAPRVMASQWRAEAPAGFEVEIDSNNEFPRPSTVPWSKEMANIVHLIGNVGRDMDIKYLDTGKVVAKSSLAVSRNSLKKDDPPSWFEMEFWDSLAEIAGHHLKKGDQVYVTGRLMVDSFMKGDVNQRTARVVVNNVHFVEGNRATATDSGRGTSSPWTQARTSRSPAATNKYAEVNAETEKLWNAFFSDPDHWWDNRAKKPSPKSPDFKHKTTNEALWIVSRRTPAWVPLQLEKLEAARQEFIAKGGNPSGGRSQSRSNTFSGADFKDF